MPAMLDRAAPASTVSTATATLIETSPGAVVWHPVDTDQVRWGLVSSTTDTACSTLSPTISLTVARSDTADLACGAQILVENAPYSVQRTARLYDGDVVSLTLSGPPWRPTEADEEQALVKQLLATSPGAITWSVEVAVASNVDEVSDWDAVANVDAIGTSGFGQVGPFPGLVNERTMVEEGSEASFTVTMLEAAISDLLPIPNCTRIVIDGGGTWIVERRIQQADGHVAGVVLGRQVAT